MVVRVSVVGLLGCSTNISGDAPAVRTLVTDDLRMVISPYGIDDMRLAEEKTAGTAWPVTDVTCTHTGDLSATGIHVTSEDTYWMDGDLSDNTCSWMCRQYIFAV